MVGGGADSGPRSGGHSYAGYSTPNDALIVDLSGLSGVQVNADGTAVSVAGDPLIDIYTALGGACQPVLARRPASLISRLAAGSACCPVSTC